MSNFKDTKASLLKINILPLFSNERNANETKTKETIVGADVEKVKAIDEKIVELVLKSDQTVDTKNGFLIEVFLSGTDGKITRMYRDSIEDLYGNITEIGFSEYLIVSLDEKE